VLDPKDLYRVELHQWLDVAGVDVTLIHLLDGYIDAGSVTHSTARYILDQCEHEPMVIFDHDQLHDYRSRRPQFTFDTNTWVSMHDFSLVIYRVLDSLGKPFLLFTGPEPDSQWNRAAAAILQICHKLSVKEVLTCSGVPMAVPHTRPTLITSHATDPSLVLANPVWIDRVQIPGSFSHLLEFKAGEAGIVGRGFLAHVPHYLAQAAFPQAIEEILIRFNEAAGLSIPLSGIHESAVETLATINKEAADDSEFPRILAALEEQYDQMKLTGAASVPSAEEIGAAVEQFLAEQDPPEVPGFG
jgi:hypothetical protein